MTQDDKMAFINNVIGSGGTIRSIGHKDKAIPSMLIGYRGFNILAYFSEQNCPELQEFVDKWQGVIVEIKKSDDIIKIVDMSK